MTTNVCLSISAHFIFAPVRANGIAVAAYVCEGIMTSSFSLNPQDIADSSRAAVQLETANADLAPVYILNFFSNSSWYAPCVSGLEFFITCVTSAISSVV